jgi:CheY-like chemotaxis protein
MSDEVKKRILFVDDDPSILAGLKGVLFRDRKRWDMVFAQGGDAAIAELDAGTFDAVVSDMRMPGIDGAMLLERVRRLAPQTRRVILSGSADADDVQRAAAAAEEVLTKPCDAVTLRGTLERLLARGGA